MTGNGKVFVSHAQSDNDRCAPLLTALHAWGVDYWFDLQDKMAGSNVSQRIQQALEARNVLLRVCTPALRDSFFCGLEEDMFLALQSQDHSLGHQDKRKIIDLVLDHGYKLRPLDYVRVYIDATQKPPDQWLADLRRALVAEPAEAPVVIRPDPDDGYDPLPDQTRAQKYYAFFQDLLDTPYEFYKFLPNPRKANAKDSYCLFASGYSGMPYLIAFAQRRQIRTGLYIDWPNADMNSRIFNGLADVREKLQTSFAEPLEFEPLEGKRACRINLYRPATIDDTLQALEETKQWAIDRLITFTRSFDPELRRLLEQEQH